MRLKITLESPITYKQKGNSEDAQLMKEATFSNILYYLAKMVMKTDDPDRPGSKKIYRDKWAMCPFVGDNIRDNKYFLFPR